MTVGQKINKALYEKGLTIKYLSEKTGIHRNTIRNYIRNDVEPSFFNICCIAQVLDLSLEYLAGWEDNNGKN